MKGDDPAFRDLNDDEKDHLEKKLRGEARKLVDGRHRKERNRKLNRANEISRRKSKRSHKGTD
jgi:hypothetical protein